LGPQGKSWARMQAKSSVIPSDDSSRDVTLLHDLHQCRSRARVLEQELETRERLEKNREASAKTERLQSEARLLEVRRRLEEKLQARIDELGRAGAQSRELQKELNEAQAELGFKDQELRKARNQLSDMLAAGHDQHMRRHEELREVLHCAAREAALWELTRLGADQLQKCLLQDPDATDATSVKAPSKFCKSLQESAQRYANTQEELIAECRDRKALPQLPLAGLQAELK